MKTDKIILRDSEDAAKPHTVNGWLSSKGQFFFDENSARYHGCTHLDCVECGKPSEKPYNKCKTCRDRSLLEKYNAYPHADISKIEFLYSLSYEKYFSDISEALDFCEEEEIEPDELLLVNCVPAYLSEIDSSQWQDLYPEDFEDEDVLSKELIAAMKALNEIIRNHKPISYFPVKERVSII